jgi:hypothetical protein
MIYLLYTHFYILICINLYEKFICSASPSVYFYSLSLAHNMLFLLFCYITFVLFHILFEHAKINMIFSDFLQYTLFYIYFALSWNLWLLSSLKYCKLLYIKVTPLYRTIFPLSITFSRHTNVKQFEEGGGTLWVFY